MRISIKNPEYTTNLYNYADHNGKHVIASMLEQEALGLDIVELINCLAGFEAIRRKELKKLNLTPEEYQEDNDRLTNYLIANAMDNASTSIVNKIRTIEIILDRVRNAVIPVLSELEPEKKEIVAQQLLDYIEKINDDIITIRLHGKPEDQKNIESYMNKFNIMNPYFDAVYQSYAQKHKNTR